MYITRKDVEKVLAVMDEFPGAKSYRLDSERHSGIGSTLTLIMEMKLNERDATVSVEISGVENW